LATGLVQYPLLATYLSGLISLASSGAVGPIKERKPSTASSRDKIKNCVGPLDCFEKEKTEECTRVLLLKIIFIEKVTTKETKSMFREKNEMLLN